MAAEVKLPDLGSVHATVSVWHLQAGEPVYEGDRLVEVIIAGATIDVPAPVSGVVRDRFVLPGDRVEAGQTLGTIDPEE